MAGAQNQEAGLSLTNFEKKKKKTRKITETPWTSDFLSAKQA